MIWPGHGPFDTPVARPRARRVFYACRSSPVRTVNKLYGNRLPITHECNCLGWRVSSPAVGALLDLGHLGTLRTGPTPRELPTIPWVTPLASSIYIVSLTMFRFESYLRILTIHSLTHRSPALRLALCGSLS